MWRLGLNKTPHHFHPKPASQQKAFTHADSRRRLNHTRRYAAGDKRHNYECYNFFRQLFNVQAALHGLQDNIEETMNIFKVKEDKIKYSEIPDDANLYTNDMDKKYSTLAKYYDFFITLFPLWKIWLKKVIPFIEGPKVLEVSFGTGYLMANYAKDYHTYGIDYSDQMIQITTGKLKEKGLIASISKGKVEHLPYPNNTFDTVINTMAFTGYPNGDKALSEMKRVLKKDGKLLLLDFDYPSDKNIIGYSLVKIGEKYGDVMKDIKAYLKRSGLTYREINVGGFGSVYLFVCSKT